MKALIIDQVSQNIRPFLEKNGAEVDYYPWDTYEPSKYDGYDGVYEDYLMLWFRDGRWAYNDSRNDPVRDYPGMYSGQIGYVCEFE